MDKTKMSGIAVFFMVAGVGAAMLIYPQACVEGALSGLKLCASVVIPSLFPFLAVSAFACSSSAVLSAMRVFSPLMRFVFRLPACAASALIFGLFGGFPVGCSMAAKLHAQGELTTEQAQRVTCFCVNAGPAFVITAVGSVMLGDVKSGLILFVSLLLSCVTIGAVLALVSPAPQQRSVDRTVNISNTKALVESVESGAAAMFKICAWTVLFSCVLKIASTREMSESVTRAFSCIFEVTSGCSAIVGKENLCAVAATLGWGGLCVGCQVMGYIKAVGASGVVFFAFRAVNAGLSAVYCGLLLKVFPVEVNVFSNVASVSAREFSYSVPATVALMCLCAVFVIDLDRNRKVC